jgi:hypothetical protein
MVSNRSSRIFVCGLFLVVMGFSGEKVLCQTGEKALCPTQKQSTKFDVDDTTGAIACARTVASERVMLLSQRFSPNTPDYQTAVKEYGNAEGAYNAWDAYLVSAIGSGREKKLDRNPAKDVYNGYVARATTGYNEFIGYSDSKTGTPSKAVTTVISSLADLGLSVWTKWKDSPQGGRCCL